MLTDLLLETELEEKSWFRLTSSVLDMEYMIYIFPIEETGLSGKIHTHKKCSSNKYVVEWNLRLEDISLINQG